MSSILDLGKWTKFLKFYYYLQKNQFSLKKFENRIFQFINKPLQRRDSANLRTSAVFRRDLFMNIEFVLVHSKVILKRVTFETGSQVPCQRQNPIILKNIAI